MDIQQYAQTLVMFAESFRLQHGLTVGPFAAHDAIEHLGVIPPSREGEAVADHMSQVLSGVAIEEVKSSIETYCVRRGLDYGVALDELDFALMYIPTDWAYTVDAYEELRLAVLALI